MVVPKVRGFRVLLLVAVVIGLQSCVEEAPQDETAGGIVISSSWAREPVPGRDVGVGYFVIDNQLDTSVQVLGAVVEGVRAVEMHTTQEVDGMMRMRRLDVVEVAPGESIEFRPGGRHLMLFGVPEGAVELPGYIEVESVGKKERIEVVFPLRPFNT